MNSDKHTTTDTLETSRAAHVAALVFVMLVPTVSTLLYFVVFSGRGGMQSLYFGSKVVQFAFPLVWVVALQRRKVRPTRPEWRSIVWGFTIGVLIVSAGLAAYFGYFKTVLIQHGAAERIGAKIDEMGLTDPEIYLAFAVFLSVPHSLLEEYYWRWFAFGQLRRVVPVGGAIVLSSLAFMSHHVIVIDQFMEGPVMVAFFSFCVAFGGGVWAWLYQRQGSLYGLWISHLLVDCGIMFIGYDLVFRN